MKRGLNEGDKSETGNGNAWSQIEITTQREQIVTKLNGICNQLLKWGLSNHPGMVSRCQFFRVAIYATSVQLQALKDKELDDLRKDVDELKKEVQKIGETRR